MADELLHLRTYEAIRELRAKPLIPFTASDLGDFDANFDDHLARECHEEDRRRAIEKGE